MVDNGDAAGYNHKKYTSLKQSEERERVKLEMKNTETKTALSARELSQISIFVVMTAVLAQIAILLPFTPAPISFGLVGVYITGMLLKPKHALLAQVCYLLLGGFGVPVFGNFRSGIAALFGPTGGYLVVYPLMAWIVAMTLNRRKSRAAEYVQSKKLLVLKTTISLFVAHTILYLAGTAWLSFTTGTTFMETLAFAVLPFIPLDMVKIAFCVMVILPFRSRLISMNLLMLDDAFARLGE